MYLLPYRQQEIYKCERPLNLWTATVFVTMVLPSLFVLLSRIHWSSVQVFCFNICLIREQSRKLRTSTMLCFFMGLCRCCSYCSSRIFEARVWYCKCSASAFVAFCRFYIDLRKLPRLILNFVTQKVTVVCCIEEQRWKCMNTNTDFTPLFITLCG